MAADHIKVIATLNNLIETCKDGENGYQTAAHCVKNDDLKALFASYAKQRGLYAAELQGEVSRLGGDPEKTGSIAGALWRGWTNIKSAVTGGDEGAVIAECERGEDSAKKNYEEALHEGGLPADVQAMVERQYAGIKEAHDRIRALEVATSHA
jgi:uncharacterized protein (TIGR02284 family)